MRTSDKRLITLTTFGLILIFIMGSWWLYLIASLGKILQKAGLHSELNTFKLVKWEGGAFLLITLLILTSLLVLFWRDRKKTRALQAFFSSVTHELKTPLANIRLQAEVLKERVTQNQVSKNPNGPTGHIVKAVRDLEVQMDKVLQLSRVEQGGKLSLINIDLLPFLHRLHEKWQDTLELTISAPFSPIINADEMALELIFKNLFENTIRHTNSPKASIQIQTRPENGQAIITYQDEGKFTGEIRQLGGLFYKHRSRKGSGIGLYLIKKLTKAMGGEVRILPTKNSWTLEQSFKLGVVSE